MSVFIFQWGLAQVWGWVTGIEREGGGREAGEGGAGEAETADGGGGSDQRCGEEDVGGGAATGDGDGDGDSGEGDFSRQHEWSQQWLSSAGDEWSNLGNPDRLDLRLILQFPPTSTASSSSSTVQSTLQNRYGPIAHVVVTDPPQPEPGKKKKKKGRKALVEFGPGNWGGCWACWRDHDDEGRAGGRVEEGVRAKWAGGRVPDWVDWAARQSHGHDGQPNGHDPQSASNGNGNGNGHEPSAPTFGSAPDFGGTIMADLLAQHARQKESKIEARKKENEYESMTLLRMRQMERDRLAEQIRREEEEEGMA